jgi:hypothetical protein
MKQQARELLVTTKVAQHWQEDFDQKVEELMLIVSKVDNQKQVNDEQPLNGRKKKVTDRPFEFLVFRN